MEVKIYLHYQQISKSTVRTLKKVQAVTFPTNCGLLKQLNFCRRKSMTSNGNQRITRNNDDNSDNTSNSSNNNGSDIPDKFESQEKV